MEDKERTSDASFYSGRFLLVRVLYACWIYILLSIIVGGVGGFVYGKLKTKPVYTVSSNVMLVVSLKNTTIYNELSLSKMYIPKISQVIISESISEKANELYTEENYGEVDGEIDANSIAVTYGESSLIFTIDYSDYSEKVASDKFDALIKAIKKELNENVYDYVNADSVNLVDTQTNPSVSMSYSIRRPIIFGAAIGGGLCLAIVLLIYIFDNKIKDSNELEKITGVNTLSFIDKI